MHHDTMKEKQKTKKILHSRIRKGVDSFMGIYLNPGSEAFRQAVTDDIYIDKTNMIRSEERRVGKECRL